MIRRLLCLFKGHDEVEVQELQLKTPTGLRLWSTWYCCFRCGHHS